MVADRQEEPATEREYLLAMVEVVSLYKSQHDDECNCEACNAYEAATDEVEPSWGREAQVPAPLDVERLAQIIREVDGNHSLGAGALAEAIVARLNQPSTEPALHVFDLNDAWVVHRREDHHDDEGCWPVPCSTRITPRLFPHVAEGPISRNSASTEPAQGGTDR